MEKIEVQHDGKKTAEAVFTQLEDGRPLIAVTPVLPPRIVAMISLIFAWELFDLLVVLSIAYGAR